MDRIVVGVDGSAASGTALRWAADLADRLGATLEVVQVSQYPPDLRDWEALPSNYGFLPMVPPPERVEQDVRADLVPDPLDGRRSPRPRSVGEAMTTDVVTVRRTRRSRSSPT